MNDGFFSIKKNHCLSDQKTWLVGGFFTTHLKNMLVKKGSFPQGIGVKIKKYLKPPPSWAFLLMFPFFFFDHPWRVVMEQKIPWLYKMVPPPQHLDLEDLLLASPQRSFDSFFDSRIHTWFQSGKGTLYTVNKLLGLLDVWSWESKGTPPQGHPPPRNKALIRPYYGKPMVNSSFIRPYFLGGVALGGSLRFPWYEYTYRMMPVISLGRVSRQVVSRHIFWKSHVAQQKQQTHQKNMYILKEII